MIPRTEAEYARDMMQLARKEGRIAAMAQKHGATEKQAAKRKASCRPPRKFHYDPSIAKKPKPRTAPAYERFLSVMRQHRTMACADLAAALGVKKTRVWQFVSKARLQGVSIETIQTGPRDFSYRVAE